MIQIDINASDVVEKIQSTLADDPYSRRLDAIAHARDLVLNKYQLFPFLVQQIRDFKACQQKSSEKQFISLYPRHWYHVNSIRQLLKYSPSTLAEIAGDLLRVS